MAFQQGLSGLDAASKNLDVIGNNVANSNTVGFKQSIVQFSDVYANTLAGAGGTQAGSVQSGTGASVSSVAQQFTQGNITSTSNSMDIAINGNGFYRMDNNGAISYSRNGQFQLDKNGFVVDSNGYKLTGYPVGANGAVITSTPGPMQIPAAPLMPQATANITAGVSLSANAPAPATAAFNPLDPTSYNNATSTTVYDTLGNSHVSAVYFQRQPIALAPLGSASMAAGSTTMTLGSTAGLAAGNTLTVAGVIYTVGTVLSGTTLTVSPTAAVAVGPVAPTATNAPSSTWNSYLTVDGAPVPTPAAPLSVLTFSPTGTLLSPASPVLSAAFTPAGAAAQTMTFNFAGTSQYGTAFGVNSLSQDGFATGQLNGVNTSADGTIVGKYTNGQSKTLGQVVLASFSNSQGLQTLSNNQWAPTGTSGAALVGVPGSSSLGVLQSGAVEDSNVDLTKELVNMITAQRDYQANAQSIKTQDQLMQTMINLR
ncbi:MAG: flagellar hook protein FlgE [Gallionella sp.]